jgi:hypothetical protein
MNPYSNLKFLKQLSKIIRKFYQRGSEVGEIVGRGVLGFTGQPSTPLNHPPS